MKQRSHTVAHPLATLAVVFALLVLGAGFLLIQHGHTDAKALPGKATAKPIQSQFSFSGASGWPIGPTNETSMALFRDDGECFTSIEHKPGTVDVDTEIQKQQSMLASSGNTMTPESTATAIVQTSTGSHQYELHEFNLSSGDTSQPLMGGLGLGYVQLSHSYLYIQSHCNTADELPTTVPALQAYRFTATKETPG